MSTYAIGDIQGCFNSFQSLLKHIEFKPLSDQLWLVGDILNRGTGSLQMLRWAHEHKHAVKMVLGNHDLHTITVAEGFAKAHRGDTLQAILEAPDRESLLTWLRHQPLLHAEGDYLMVHAGLLPQWSTSQAKLLAAEVESALQSPNYRDFLIQMYGSQPTIWIDDLQGFDRLRIITNAMTRMRICSIRGEMEFKFKGEVADIPPDWMPWFEAPNRKTSDVKILCGHWSALGLKIKENIFALDTGCLWGGQLTALQLENQQIFQVPCDLRDRPL
jgi:bis(5'-nucleosyl)-tetraphosphatase (symmetrical)